MSNSKIKDQKLSDDGSSIDVTVTLSKDDLTAQAQALQDRMDADKISIDIIQTDLDDLQSQLDNVNSQLALFGG
jgi:MarR-like DNA-binding transcriptional regulator SgrR of sgrS sRNA